MFEDLFRLLPGRAGYRPGGIRSRHRDRPLDGRQATRGHDRAFFSVFPPNGAYLRNRINNSSHNSPCGHMVTAPACVVLASHQTSHTPRMDISGHIGRQSGHSVCEVFRGRPVRGTTRRTSRDHAAVRVTIGIRVTNKASGIGWPSDSPRAARRPAVLERRGSRLRLEPGQMMTPPARRGLLDDMENFVREQFDGQVTRPIVVTFTTAKAT